MNLLFSGDNFFTIDPANNHSHIPLLSVPHEGVVHLWYTRGPVAHCYRGAIRDELQDRAAHLTQITHNPEARFARVQHIPPLRLWWDDIREREVQFLIINVRGIELFFARYTLRVRETAPLSLQLTRSIYSTEWILNTYIDKDQFARFKDIDLARCGCQVPKKEQDGEYCRDQEQIWVC